MKTLTTVLISLSIIFASGCDFDDVFDKVKDKEQVVEQSLAIADPIVSALEASIPEWEGMNAETQSKIVDACQKAVIGGEKLDKVLEVIETFVPVTKPYLDGAQGIIGLISSALLSVGLFIKNRKAKTAEKIAVAQMVAGEDVSGFGVLARAAAASMDVGADAEALYKANFKA